MTSCVSSLDWIFKLLNLQPAEEACIAAARLPRGFDQPPGSPATAGGDPVTNLHRSIEAEIPRLRRYARALTRDVLAADDLVQDCLARALGKLHLWQQGSDMRAWLFTILHNEHVNQVRHSVRVGAAVAL